jgi:hypothetical protein
VESTVSANFNANALIDVLKIAYSAHNKDKNGLCRAVDLSEKTIVDWYNEINFAYAPFRTSYILGKDMSDKKIISNFLIFAESRTNSHAIESSMQYLDKIKEKCDAGELRKIVGNVDIHLIEDFSHKLKEFRDVVFDTKLIMLEDGLPKLNGTKEDAKSISTWIKKLDENRSKIRTTAMEILQELECSQEMYNKISNHSRE